MTGVSLELLLFSILASSGLPEHFFIFTHKVGFLGRGDGSGKRNQGDRKYSGNGQDPAVTAMEAFLANLEAAIKAELQAIASNAAAR